MQLLVSRWSSEKEEEEEESEGEVMYGRKFSTTISTNRISILRGRERERERE